MRSASEVACCANVLARWCGPRDVGALEQAALAGEAKLPEGRADLFVLFGGGVTGTVDTLAQAMRAHAADRYAIVGGRGRATYWLDQAIEHELAAGTELSYVTPGTSSEAEMLDALLFAHHGLHADLLETSSSNCGNNITFLFDLLEREGRVPTSVILCQDSVMQRRMDATWRRQAMSRSAFAPVQLINYAAYEAELACENGNLVWRHAPEGIWPIDTYLQLLVGEVMRLSDDESGYGPCGQDFVVRVEVPVEVRQAAAELAYL